MKNNLGAKIDIGLTHLIAKYFDFLDKYATFEFPMARKTNNYLSILLLATVVLALNVSCKKPLTPVPSPEQVNFEYKIYENNLSAVEKIELYQDASLIKTQMYSIVNNELLITESAPNSLNVFTFHFKKLNGINWLLTRYENAKNGIVVQSTDYNFKFNNAILDSTFKYEEINVANKTYSKVEIIVNTAEIKKTLDDPNASANAKAQILNAVFKNNEMVFLLDAENLFFNSELIFNYNMQTTNNNNDFKDIKYTWNNDKKLTSMQIILSKIGNNYPYRIENYGFTYVK